MKKVLKFIGIAMLVLLAAFLILGLTQPKDLITERSIVIKAPQETVFQQIKFFKNWTNWSPWIAKEPNVKITYQGNDGEAGSSYQWNGDELGEGEMKNVSINDKRMNFVLQFIKPWSGKADGFLNTEAQADGTTKVTWNMVNHASFPMNAFNYFMKNVIGSDFEEGLKLMKKYVEEHPNSGMSTANNIVEKEFPATLYASIRKKLPWSEMQQFSTDAFGKLSTACGDRIVGTASTIYYEWNEQTQSTDMAPAFPVSGSDPVKGAEMLSIPKSMACTMEYKGAYSNLAKAHEALGQYIAQKGKTLNLVLEEYPVSPANEPDSNKWVTNIIYILK